MSDTDTLFDFHTVVANDMAQDFNVDALRQIAVAARKRGQWLQGYAESANRPSEKKEYLQDSKKLHDIANAIEAVMMD